MQSGKGAQFLNIAFLFELFAAPPAASGFRTVIVTLTSKYESL